MSFEKEIKVLDIDVADTEKRLQAMGAEFISKNKQKIYTYDLQTISHRLLEIIDSLKTISDPLVVGAYKQKLKTVLLEAEDLILDDKIVELKKKYGIKYLSELVDSVIDTNELVYMPILTEISKLGINPNKWVRLRESGSKTTLTVKHVFEKNDHSIQKVAENEIKVDNIEETNSLLMALGFSKRNVQEKIRTQYKYKDAELDIDEWPMLNPYLEIESSNESIFQEIIDKLGLRDKQTDSCNTEELYRRIGVNIKETPELLFK